MHNSYYPLDTPADTPLSICPACNAVAGLWRHTEAEVAADLPHSVPQYVVMCNYGDRIGPQRGMRHEGCLLHMPPDAFYKAQISEAITYWNDFARALRDLRLRHHQRALVRAQAPGFTAEPLHT